MNKMKTEFLKVDGMDLKVLKKKMLVDEKMESYLVYTERGIYCVKGNKIDKMKYYGKTENDGAYEGTIKKAVSIKEIKKEDKVA